MIGGKNGIPGCNPGHNITWRELSGFEAPFSFEKIALRHAMGFTVH